MIRRSFLKHFGTAAGATLIPSFASAAPAAKKPLFDISLAQWSLHRALKDGKMTNLDFPKVSKEDYGISAVEYVNQFFKDKAKDMTYLSDLKKRSEDVEVTNVLIMIDGEGHLGHDKPAELQKTIDNHKRWVEAAKFLGCHSIRVNAHGYGADDAEKAAMSEWSTKAASSANRMASRPPKSSSSRSAKLSPRTTAKRSTPAR
jgi:hypothetical protein